jgi:hypothetical protein
MQCIFRIVFSKWFGLIAVSIFSFFFIYLRGSSVSGDWMDCAIARDFKRYEKEGISRDLLETTWQSCKSRKEFLRYQVIDSKIYGPQSSIKVLLEELVSHYSVPDVDFIYVYEDRLKQSFFKRKSHRNSAPLFVSAKNPAIDQVILFADWNYNIRDESEGWNFMIKKINEEHLKWDWQQKREKLLWRGKPWDGKHFGMYNFDNWMTIPRGHLVAESIKNPEWIDAVFSEYPASCAIQDLNRCVREMGALRFVPWEEVLHYKYHMIIDGVTCSYPATQWKLLSGCLSFMQKSEDIQYYYDELIPWKHYIPVNRDLSDLRDKLLWAKTHDNEAQEIAKNAREFVLTHLMPEHILLYCYKVLCKYASLQTFQPSIE